MTASDAAATSPAAPAWWVASARAIAGMAWVIIGCLLLLAVFAERIILLTERVLGGIHPAMGVRFGVPAAVLVLAFVGMLLFRRPFRLARRRRELAWIAFPIGVGAVLALLAIAVAGGVAVPGAEPPPVVAGALLTGALVIFVQVLGEEMLLRGLLQPLLTRAWGAALGVLLTALTFTFIHVLGGWKEPISLLNITLAGIWFGLLALRTSGLAAPTLAHFGYNWGEEMLIGASPNPGVGDFGALFDYDLAGPGILGGSVDGFNASIILSLVLLALIAPLALRRGGSDANGRPGAQA
jgi:membrane protease YdiL (CAAX protease family)